MARPCEDMKPYEIVYFYDPNQKPWDACTFFWYNGCIKNRTIFKNEHECFEKCGPKNSKLSLNFNL